ncbi:MAG: PQQ-dependent sugar dehydrogenase [Halioglobus sp.]
MKKILLLILIIILAVPAYLIMSGTVSLTSVKMLVNVMTGKGIDTPAEKVISRRFTVPEGFSMNLYAGNLPGARFIRVTSGGDLLVSRPHSGEVVLLRRDETNPAIAGERITLLQGLTRPTGIDVDGDWLYVGESNAIGRVPFDASNGTLAGDYRPIITGLTDDGNHPYKMVHIGPDQKLYLSQGSTCNVCLEKDTRRSTLMRYNLDGTGEETYATGLRNSMGMDWAPWDQALYATDNGRDLLGDDYPVCELNRIEQGQFYGWPWYNDDNEIDPDFNKPPAEIIDTAVAPVHGFRAHNAPLGMSFVNTDGWPGDFDRVALVALHGSWNRSSADGYKVVSVHFDGDTIQERDFLTGFELAGDIIGRPVDVAQGADGAIYISDDYAGAIYRIVPGAGTNEAFVLPTEPAEVFELLTPEWLENAEVDTLSQRGAVLFEQYACNSCHNPDTSTGKLNLAKINQRLQYDDVINKLDQPTAPMPRFELDDSDRQALAVFLINVK